MITFSLAREILKENKISLPTVIEHLKLDQENVPKAQKREKIAFLKKRGSYKVDH